MNNQETNVDLRLFDFSTYCKEVWDMKADIFGWAVPKNLPLLSMTREGVIVWWTHEHLREMDRVGAYKCSFCLSRRALPVRSNCPMKAQCWPMVYKGAFRNFFAILHPHCWVKARNGDYGLRTEKIQGGGFLS